MDASTFHPRHRKDVTSMTDTRTRRPKAPGRWYRRGGAVLLAVVAAIGAVLSWSSLYAAATTHLGQGAPTLYGINVVGAAFPLLLDALILAASWFYVGGVKQQRPAAGWRMAAHAAIAGTLVANWASAPTLADAPWHIAAPAVWSIVVELLSKDALGELRERRRVLTDRIPLRLWLSSPAESARTSWRMARTGERSAAAARTSSDACAAAASILRRTLPGAENASARRQITRRLWAGTILPTDVLTACGWGDVDVPATPDAILRVALRRALFTASGDPVHEPTDASGDQLTDLVTGPAHSGPVTAVDRFTGPAQSGPVSRVSGPAQSLSPQVTASEPAAAKVKAPVSQDAMDKVLKAVRSGQPMGKSAIVAATGLSQSTATRAVAHLVDTEQLTTIGSSTRPEYILASGVPAVTR